MLFKRVKDEHEVEIFQYTGKNRKELYDFCIKSTLFYENNNKYYVVNYENNTTHQLTKGDIIVKDLNSFSKILTVISPEDFSFEKYKPCVDINYEVNISKLLSHEDISFFIFKNDYKELEKYLIDTESNPNAFYKFHKKLYNEWELRENDLFIVVPFIISNNVYILIREEQYVMINDTFYLQLSNAQKDVLKHYGGGEIK